MRKVPKWNFQKTDCKIYPFSHFLFIRSVERQKNQSEQEVSARSGPLTGLAPTERCSDFPPLLRNCVTPCCECTAGPRLWPRPLSLTHSRKPTRTPKSLLRPPPSSRYPPLLPQRAAPPGGRSAAAAPRGSRSEEKPRLCNEAYARCGLVFAGLFFLSLHTGQVVMTAAERGRNQPHQSNRHKMSW